MKRFLIVAVLIGVVAIFGLASVVSAQDDFPRTPPAPGQGYGRQGGGMGMMGAQTEAGPMHEYMQAALAESLGLSVEELEKRHADGETFWQIAESKGYSLEQARQMMLDARSAALDALVKDGVLTQEQADWMKNRGGRMSGAGMGRGRGGCMGGGFDSDGTAAPRGRWSRDG